MAIAALIAWIITALGGFYLLGTWISHGGHRQPGASRFPPALIFSHFGLAATGLVLWIVYVALDSDGLTWIAFLVVLVAALLGFVMLSRWIPTYRSAPATAGDAQPAERHFPLAVVIGHGILAATTLVLVLLAALET
jgi:manganese efflux pump family protein